MSKQPYATAAVLRSFLPRGWSAFWFLLLVLSELLLPWLRGCSFMSNTGIDESVKAGLVVLIVLSCAAIVWLIALYFRFVRAVLRRLNSRVVLLMTRLGASATFAIAVSLYIASWFFFWRLGNFLRIETAVFGMLNARMLIHYFWQTERMAFVAAVGVCCAVALVSATWAWRSLHRRETERQPWVVGAIIVLIAVNAGSYAIWNLESTSPALTPLADRIAAFRDPWPSYSFELRFRVNPLMSVLTGMDAWSDAEAKGEIPRSALVPINIRRSASLARLPTPQRSVLLITVESLRSDVVLMQHQGSEIMPCVNSLARTGRYFPNCYVQSVHSDYSDPCILSSLYPLRKSCMYFYSRTDPWPKVLVYDLLQADGYSTAIFSSQNETWGNMHLFYESPNLDVLFDSRSFEGSTSAQKGYFTHWMTETGQTAGKLDDAITAREAIEWMTSQHESGRPFFVSMNFQTSHFPYQMPNGRKGPFQPAELDFDLSLIEYPREKAMVVRNAYFNALRYIDDQISHLVQFLDESGLRADTVICITGDHGQAFYENGEASHGQSLLETTTKVGLVLNCPGHISRMVDEYLAQSIDIAPTITMLIGIPPHPGFQGVDLLSEARAPTDERLVFMHCKNAVTGQDAVVSGTGWKYIWDTRRGRSSLLYRPTDYESHRNLSAIAPRVAAVMHKILAEWRRRQLLYYARPGYYHWYYAPKEPRASAPELCLLKSAAEERDDLGRGQSKSGGET